MLPVVAALTLAAVLEHAGAYVTNFEHTPAGIVAEEHYHQDWRALTGRTVADADRRRDLVAAVSQRVRSRRAAGPRSRRFREFQVNVDERFLLKKQP